MKPSPSCREAVGRHKCRTYGAIAKHKLQVRLLYVNDKSQNFTNHQTTEIAHCELLGNHYMFDITALGPVYKVTAHRF
jgi:hypothetical protein